MQVFRCNVYKLGLQDIHETIHCIANNSFHAAHIFWDYAYENGHYKFPVEIDGISRVREIEDIINPETIFEMLDEDDDDTPVKKYSGNMPIDIAKDLPEDECIFFACECHEKLRVPASPFPYVTCPNCGLDIKRFEIKSAGGLYYYEKQEKK